MIVLSLEAERIMSGFSDEVANAVTQPLCPNSLIKVQARHYYLEESLLERDCLP